MRFDLDACYLPAEEIGESIRPAIIFG